jgi:hypothetical protein
MQRESNLKPPTALGLFHHRFENLTTSMEFENVTVQQEGTVAVVTLNRAQQLNALSYGLVKDLCLALEQLDGDIEVRVIILTGGDKVFAAGADIKEMADLGPFDERVQGRLAYRDRVNTISKPIIAAVSPPVAHPAVPLGQAIGTMWWTDERDARGHVRRRCGVASWRAAVISG